MIAVRIATTVHRTPLGRFSVANTNYIHSWHSVGGKKIRWTHLAENRSVLTSFWLSIRALIT